MQTIYMKHKKLVVTMMRNITNERLDRVEGEGVSGSREAQHTLLQGRLGEKVTEAGWRHVLQFPKPPPREGGQPEEGGGGCHGASEVSQP